MLAVFTFRRAWRKIRRTPEGLCSWSTKPLGASFHKCFPGNTAWDRRKRVQSSPRPPGGTRGRILENPVFPQRDSWPTFWLHNFFSFFCLPESRWCLPRCTYTFYGGFLFSPCGSCQCWWLRDLDQSNDVRGLTPRSLLLRWLRLSFRLIALSRRKLRWRSWKESRRMKVLKEMASWL